MLRMVGVVLFECVTTGKSFSLGYGLTHARTFDRGRDFIKLYYACRGATSSQGLLPHSEWQTEKPLDLDKAAKI